MGISFRGCLSFPCRSNYGIILPLKEVQFRVPEDSRTRKKPGRS
jgi:hypothetical protein